MYSEKIQMLINGRWCDGSKGDSQPLINPATEEVLAHVPHASEADLEEAIQSSDKGFKIWRSFTPLARQVIMEKAARLMEERRDAISKTLTLEMGKPLAEAKIEMGFVIDVTRWYAEEGKRAYGRIV